MYLCISLYVPLFFCLCVSLSVSLFVFSFPPSLYLSTTFSFICLSFLNLRRCKRFERIFDHLREVGHHELEDEDEPHALGEHVKQSDSLYHF